MTDNTATDRAREALEGVTPGPWETNVDGAGDYFITRPDGQTIVEISGGDDASEPDAKFVAAARSLVPDLLAAIDALRAEVRAARELSPIVALLPDVADAANKAMRKFPQPNYVISKWAEETGEVTKAAIHMAEGRESPAALRGEIVQALAMLHRMLVEGDEVHGLPPVAAAIDADALEKEQSDD